MPDSISTAKHPVGIVIQHGTSRTTSSRLWAFVWSVVREQDPEPWHRRIPTDPNPS